MANPYLRLRNSSKMAALALTMLITNSAAGQQIDPVEDGWSVEQNRSDGWNTAQAERLATAVAALQPQRDGVVDAFVVSIALDSDPVFGREAKEAARVLGRRYAATGRTLFLAAGADDKVSGPPQGSPRNFARALAAVAQRMNRQEDVLILFATTHGDPVAGLAYRDGSSGVGMVAPDRLAELLDSYGIQRRIILLSACFAGVFVPKLKGENSAIVTAASATRPSFGCAPGNDWTFFGDALINHALRKPQPFETAAKEAAGLIGKWERDHRLVPSRPQLFIGRRAKQWLSSLEEHMPRDETAKVGRPAVEALRVRK